MEFAVGVEDGAATDEVSIAARAAFLLSAPLFPIGPEDDLRVAMLAFEAEGAQLRSEYTFCVRKRR